MGSSRSQSRSTIFRFSKIWSRELISFSRVRALFTFSILANNESSPPNSRINAAAVLRPNPTPGMLSTESPANARTSPIRFGGTSHFAETPQSGQLLDQIELRNHRLGHFFARLLISRLQLHPTLRHSFVPENCA